MYRSPDMLRDFMAKSVLRRACLCYVAVTVNILKLWEISFMCKIENKHSFWLPTRVVLNYTIRYDGELV